MISLFVQNRLYGLSELIDELLKCDDIKYVISDVFYEVLALASTALLDKVFEVLR